MTALLSASSLSGLLGTALPSPTPEDPHADLQRVEREIALLLTHPSQEQTPSPRLLEARLTRGLLQCLLSQWEAASLDLRAVLAHAHPASEEALGAWVALAEVALACQQDQEAWTCWTEALACWQRLPPESALRQTPDLLPTLTLCRGLLSLQLQQYQVALADFAHLCAWSPQDGGLLALWGGTLAAQGDLQGGLEACQRAIAIEPRALCYQQLALVHLLRQEPHQALEQILHAYQLDPSYRTDYHQILAVALQALEAEEENEQAPR